MSWFVIVYRVLFLLHFISNESDGKIISPPDGTNITIVPGGSRSIIWNFDDDINTVTFRSWSFTDGLRSEIFALIHNNSSPFSRHGSILPGFIITKPATLVLNNVGQIYDGTYTFSIETSAGNDSSSVRVFIAQKPTVTLNCSSVTLDQGDDFICECKGVDGNPPADVTWYKDGNELQGKTGTEEQLLNLANIDEADRGTYKCVAESYPDPLYRDEKSITLNVRFGPTDTSIKLKPNPAILGQSFTITCSSRGSPEPSYKISHNGSHLIDNKTYTINNVEWSHAGLYKCNAKNGLRNDKASEVLKVTERRPRTTQKPSIPNTSEKNISNGLGVWRIVVALLFGIIIGVLFSYIVFRSRRCWFRNRTLKQNSEPQTVGVDATYQELDLTKMNTEDNYQSLRGNAAGRGSNDAENNKESTYTQLSKTSDEEDNYETLI